AEALYPETIDGWVHLGHRGAVANQLENIAYLAIDRNRPERAARLLGAAEAVRGAGDAAMAFGRVAELAGRRPTPRWGWTSCRSWRSSWSACGPCFPSQRSTRHGAQAGPCPSPRR